MELCQIHGIEAVAGSGSFTRDQLQKAMGQAGQQKSRKLVEPQLSYGILEVPAPESGGIHEFELHLPGGAKLTFPWYGEAAAMAGKFLCAYEGGKR